MEANATDSRHIVHTGSRTGTSVGRCPDECLSVGLDRQDRRVTPARLLPPQRRAPLHGLATLRRGNERLIRRMLPIPAGHSGDCEHSLRCDRGRQQFPSGIHGSLVRSGTHLFRRLSRASYLAKTRPSFLTHPLDLPSLLPKLLAWRRLAGAARAGLFVQQFVSRSKEF
jgi:hypothetical protein